MRRVFVKPGLALLLAAAALVSACSAGDAKTKDAAAAERPPVSVSPVEAVEQPIARFIRATGTLMAEEQADVAAETPGRVIAAPVERGTPVAQGAELIRISPTEAGARAGRPGAQSLFRHRGALALRRRRRAAPRFGRRLRDARDESRRRRPRQPAARAAHRSGAVRRRSLRRVPGQLRS